MPFTQPNCAVSQAWVCKRVQGVLLITIRKISNKVFASGRPVNLTFHVIQIPTPLDLALTDLSDLTNSVLALGHQVGGQLPSGKTRGSIVAQWSGYSRTPLS